MAKLTRVPAKVFAESAVATEIGQFGSAVAGSKLETADVATIQGLSAWLDGWSESLVSGNRYPALQEMNGLLKVLSYQGAYALQEGIAEYDSATTYYIGSIVKKTGTFEIYGSLTNNNVGQALSDGADWKFLGDLSNLNGLPAYTNGDRVIVSKSTQDGLIEANTTTTEVNYLSGVTANVQNQIDSVVSGFVPQSVNLAATTSGQADFITAGTGLKARILASATNLVGNGQYKDKLSKFAFTTDFDTTETAIANRRSTLMYKNWSTTPAFHYTNQRPQWGPIFDVSKNLLMDFSSSLTTDKYGNTVTVLGNPTLTGGKYVGDGTGGGLKITSITSLGSAKWCIEGKFKFNNTTASMILFRGKTNASFGLSRESSNKLGLYLSSDGSTFNIANASLGAKADWNTSTEYYIKLKFTGSAYIVSWSTDGITYTNDITVTSSLIVANITALLFGFNYDESTWSLNGTMDDLRVTIGNIRADGEAFTPDAYWYDTANKIMKYGSPASWTELPECVALGEVTTNASAVVSAVSYPLNDEHGKGKPDYDKGVSKSSGFIASIDGYVYWSVNEGAANTESYITVNGIILGYFREYNSDIGSHSSLIPVCRGDFINFINISNVIFYPNRP